MHHSKYTWKTSHIRVLEAFALSIYWKYWRLENAQNPPNHLLFGLDMILNAFPFPSVSAPILSSLLVSQLSLWSHLMMALSLVEIPGLFALGTIVCKLVGVNCT